MNWAPRRYAEGMAQLDEQSRLIRCVIAAFIFGISTSAIWFGVGIALVWNSPDGQAGMGAALGALFLGAPIGGLVGYSVEYWRSGREVR
jgi:hypothetical protein